MHTPVPQPEPGSLLPETLGLFLAQHVSQRPLCFSSGSAVLLPSILSSSCACSVHKNTARVSGKEGCWRRQQWQQERSAGSSPQDHQRAERTDTKMQMFNFYCSLARTRCSPCVTSLYSHKGPGGRFYHGDHREKRKVRLLDVKQLAQGYGFYPEGPHARPSWSEGTCREEAGSHPWSTFPASS